MSSIGRWAYVNSADVYPFVRYDNNTGKAIYGKPFKIKCYFSTTIDRVQDSNGVEFVASMMFLTEDPRVKVMDLVGGKPARSVGLLNSTPFGESKMDYRIYT